MCNAAIYSEQSNRVTVYFNQPYAVLPVRKRYGDTIQLPWGRRQQQAGDLPLGGWAFLDDILGGKWDQFFPKPVKLLVTHFMEIDFENKRHWFKLVEGQWVQGLLARSDREMRVYVVSIFTHYEGTSFIRWPRIMFGEKG